MFSVLLVALALLFFTGVFQWLPNAILASIIMVSVIGLLMFPLPSTCGKNAAMNFGYWRLPSWGLFLGIAQGILLGTLAALLLLVYKTSMPHFAILGNIAGTDYYKNIARFKKDIVERADVLILRFDAQLYFGNSGYFKRAIRAEMTKKGPALKPLYSMPRP